MVGTSLSLVDAMQVLEEMVSQNESTRGEEADAQTTKTVITRGLSWVKGAVMMIALLET